jgi:hypothetical protein
LAFPDDEFDAPRAPSARRSGGEHQREIFVRRLVALGVGILILILILLGIRGCLDARKERNFENYASDLSSIVAQANQLSQAFFTRLETPPERAQPLNLEADIAADRGTAEGLLDRVESLDTPDELAGAQEDLVKSFELRRDALAGIAETIPTALGEAGRNEAIDQIAGHMRQLLASDVLYAQARAEINAVLREEEIDAKVEASIFLPEPVARWLDDDELTLILTAFAADSGQVSGVHGLELVGVRIDGTPLIAGSENTVELGGAVQIEAEVTNGGDSDEVEVPVEVEISGPTGVIEGETVISRIKPLAIGEATVRLEDDPPTETPLTLEVKAGPVLGETLLDNNSLTYTVIFE